MDSADWDSGYGVDCEGYESNEWCLNGRAVAGKEWLLGATYNYPEDNCCVCGKFEQGREFQDILRRCYAYFT